MSTRNKKSKTYSQKPTTPALKKAEPKEIFSRLNKSLSSVSEVFTILGKGIFDSLDEYDENSLGDALETLIAIRNTNNDVIELHNELQSYNSSVNVPLKDSDIEESKADEKEDNREPLRQLDELILDKSITRKTNSRNPKTEPAKRGIYKVIDPQDRAFYHAVLDKVVKEDDEENAKKVVSSVGKALGLNSKRVKYILEKGPQRGRSGRSAQFPEMEERLVKFIERLTEAGRPPFRTECKRMASYYKWQVDEEKEEGGSRERSVKSVSKGWFDKFIGRNPTLKIMKQGDEVEGDEELSEVLYRIGMFEEADWFSEEAFKEKLVVEIKEEEMYLSE